MAVRQAAAPAGGLALQSRQAEQREELWVASRLLRDGLSVLNPYAITGQLPSGRPSCHLTARLARVESFSFLGPSKAYQQAPSGCCLTCTVSSLAAAVAADRRTSCTDIILLRRRPARVV